MFEHLDALNFRLSNEKARLAAAKTQKEKSARQHIVAMVEKEISGEIEFLKSKGVKIQETSDNLTDDELLAMLEEYWVVAGTTERSR